MRSVSFAAALLLFALPCVPVAAQTPPPFGAAQLIRPADLNPQESTYYKGLTDPAAAKSFLVTRSFLRLCQQVIDRKLAPGLLPERPAAFDPKYLLPWETNVIDRASILTLRPSAVFVEMTGAQLLKPADLTARESAYYKTLTDPVAAKRYIDTRSYVRVCKLVNDGKLPAERLPDRPLGFQSNFLLPGDSDIINKAVTAAMTVEVHNLR